MKKWLKENIKMKVYKDNAGFGVVEVVLIIVVIIALVIIFNNEIKTFLEDALKSLQTSADDLLESAPEVK
jgi:competence protein ComGC